MRLAIAAFALLIAAAGCGPAAEPEPTKDNFSKREPPPGWKGPDGAPPAATPPAGG